MLLGGVVRRSARCSGWFRRRYHDATANAVGADLVEEVNKLQQVLGLLRSELSLPQIAVVGGQSSGKSSVLEHMVGRDFLPRGSGIVTRRPLVLQLMPSPSHSPDKVWAEFGHTGTVQFTDFEQVRREIERETDRVAPGQGVSSSPITLRVFAPKALPLTLVDLPGMTRVPVGNQPKDIEARLREMIEHHIKGENTIILAVHPATQDLATSDALQIAHAADPNNQRTIGVLTKVDLMDRGTDVARILDGGVVPLKLGYVPVVNRGQRDIDERVPIAQALQAEQQFFRSHPVYVQYADRCGSTYLAHKCNQLLTEHIRRTLPSLAIQIQSTLEQSRRELAECGQPLSTDASELSWVLLQLLNNYAAAYEATVTGSTAAAELSTSRLNAGARLRVLFHENFFDSLAAIDPTDGLTLDEYRTAIRNAAGPRPSLFIPDPAFQLLVRKQLDRLRAPCLQLVEMCYSEMLRIVSQIDTPELRRFPLLRDEIIDIASHLLAELRPTAAAFVDSLIDIELAYINTNHPEFATRAYNEVSNEKVPPPSSGRDASQHPTSSSSSSSSSFNPFSRLFFGSRESRSDDDDARRSKTATADNNDDLHVMGTKPSERELVQIRLIKKLLKDYFAIVIRSLQDSCIKAVWHFMIDGSKKQLHHALVSKIYKPEKSPVLLREPVHIQQRRQILLEKIKAFQQAAHIIQTYEQRRRF